MNVAKLWFLNACFSSFLAILLNACFLYAPLPYLLIHSTLCLAPRFQLCGVWKKCAKRNPNENSSTMGGWKKKKHSNQTANQHIRCAKFASHYTIHCFIFFFLLACWFVGFFTFDSMLIELRLCQMFYSVVCLQCVVIVLNVYEACCAVSSHSALRWMQSYKILAFEWIALSYCRFVRLWLQFIFMLYTLQHFLDSFYWTYEWLLTNNFECYAFLSFK